MFASLSEMVPLIFYAHLRHIFWSLVGISSVYIAFIHHTCSRKYTSPGSICPNGCSTISRYGLHGESRRMRMRWYDEEELIPILQFYETKYPAYRSSLSCLAPWACARKRQKIPTQPRPCRFCHLGKRVQLDFSDARYMSEAPTPTSMLLILFPPHLPMKMKMMKM